MQLNHTRTPTSYFRLSIFNRLYHEFLSQKCYFALSFSFFFFFLKFRVTFLPRVTFSAGSWAMCLCVSVSLCVRVSVCACDISWKRMQRARTKVRRIRFSTIKYFISHPRDTGRNLIKKFSSIEETPSNGCRSTPPSEGQGDPHRRSRSSQRPPGRPRAAPLRMRILAPCARAPARRGDNLAGNPGASELPGPERCFNEFVLH